MKTTISFPLEQYDAFLNRCKASAPEYAILLSAVIVHRPKDGHYEAIAQIHCEIADARALLRLAKRLYPDAVPAIENAIKAANNK